MQRAAYILAAVIFLASDGARSHDHWIRDGKYLDPITGQHCCSERDCLELSEVNIATVRRTSDGGLIVQGARFHRSQLHKSEDGKWYRCANRCVFRPVEG